MNPPLFSIVIPVHDRADTILRCLDSVFRQRGCEDYEIVAVDDGSTDRSLALMRDIGDPRLTVLAHRTNRGVCPARNTGIDFATGRWLVFLDSDDELATEDTLARMAALAAAAPDDLHALWFRCRLDDGRLSPDPVPAARDWDYAGYLPFLDATEGRPRDMIRCVRAACFDRLRYPEDRMLEDGFHLDFAKAFRSRLHSDVLRLYHQDAPNQLVRRVAEPHTVADRAMQADRARGFDALLATHGDALRAYAPRSFRALVSRAGGQAIRAGHARAALAWSWRFARLAPLSPRAAAMLLLAAFSAATSRLGQRQPA